MTLKAATIAAVTHMILTPAIRLIMKSKFVCSFRTNMPI